MSALSLSTCRIAGHFLEINERQIQHNTTIHRSVLVSLAFDGMSLPLLKVLTIRKQEPFQAIQTLKW